MVQLVPSRPKIPTKSPQPARAGAARSARPKSRRPARSRVLAGGAERPATRGNGNPVIELDCGVTVYPAQADQGRWRAVWYENDKRRQCEAVSEARLAVKLEKVVERLSVGAANMERPAAELIAFYLSPGRLPVDRQWSRKHAHTQARLCARFVAPVIGHLACQDITVGHMQQAVNAPPPPAKAPGPGE